MLLFWRWGGSLALAVALAIAVAALLWPTVPGGLTPAIATPRRAAAIYCPAVRQLAPRVAMDSAPGLDAVHPAVVAAFQVLASLTALLAFPAAGAGGGLDRAGR